MPSVPPSNGITVHLSDSRRSFLGQELGEALPAGAGRGTYYDESTRRAIGSAGHLIDAAAATAAWDEALLRPRTTALPSGSVGFVAGTVRLVALSDRPSSSRATL